MGFVTVIADVVQQVGIILPDNMPGLDPVVGQLLNWMNSWIGNIGWTMVLFTLLLKLITFPLDYFSRKSMKRNTMIQERLAPELEKLEKQCKGDKMLYQQKMMARMKKEGYSMKGACLPTLVTLVLFFYVFSALNGFATYNNAEVYNEMAQYYNTTVAAQTDISKEELDELLVDKYQELNPNWLWVKNPWRPDVPWVSPIASYDESQKTTYGLGKLEITMPGAEEGKPGDDAIKSAAYDAVMGAVMDRYGSANGYLILPILACAVSFLSQFITQKMQPQADPTQNSTMKIMMFIFPIMMAFFALNYTASFTVYIVCNSLYTLGGTFLINFIVGKRLKVEMEKKRKSGGASYRREA